MNRKQIIEFCNQNIFNQVNNQVSQFMDCAEVVKMVSKWRIGKLVNMEMIAKVDDGFLFINGEKVGRIAPKMPKVSYSVSADYWEGRILADRRHVMINLFRKKKKTSAESLEEINRSLEEITKRLYQENQKVIEEFYKERR